MPIPAIITDISTTPASNSPLGSESPNQLDDYIRAVSGILRAEVGGDYIDVASATTTSIGSVNSTNVRITGTTTITGFGTVAAGITRNVRFAGALTLTHNATSLILPSGANITTTANDCLTAVSLGSGNWIVSSYTYAAQVFAPLASPALTGTPTAPTATAGTNTTQLATTAFVTTALQTPSPKFRVSKSTTQAIATATTTIVTWDTEVWDVNSNFASNRFTPTVAGYYNLTASIKLQALADQQYVAVAITKNGTPDIQNIETASGAVNVQAFTVTGDVLANGTTDYFEVTIIMGTGQTIGADAYTYFCGHKIA